MPTIFSMHVTYFLKAAPLLEELDIVVACSENGEGPLRSFTTGPIQIQVLEELESV